MYAVTHFSVGLMLGQAVGNPYAACALGLASHAVLDVIPHSDYSKIIHGVWDLAGVAAIASIAIGSGTRLGALIGGSAAILPDLEVAMVHLHMAKEQSPCKYRLFFPSHSGLIPHGRLLLPWGVVTQIATAVAVWIASRGAFV